MTTFLVDTARNLQWAKLYYQLKNPQFYSDLAEIFANLPTDNHFDQV